MLAAKTALLAKGAVGADSYAKGVLTKVEGFHSLLANGVTADVVSLAAAGPALADVATTAPGNAQTLAAAVAQLAAADPANTTLQGLKALSAGVEKQVAAMAKPAASAPALAQGLINAANGAGLVEEGVSGLVYGDSARKWPGTVALADKEEGAPALAVGADALSDGVAKVRAGADKVAAGTAALAAGAGSLSSGAQSLATGAGSLSTGASSLADGTAALSEGAADLSTGTVALAEGTTALAEGSQTLADGSVELSAGATTLSDGNIQIADGSGELAAGAAGATPTVLPWLLLAALAGLVAIGFWIGHRVSHRSRLTAAPATA